MNFIEAIQKKKKKLRKDESFWLIFRPGGFKVHVPYTLHFILLKVKCLREISSLKIKSPWCGKHKCMMHSNVKCDINKQFFITCKHYFYEFIAQFILECYRNFHITHVFLWSTLWPLIFQNVYPKKGWMPEFIQQFLFVFCLLNTYVRVQ